MRRRESSMKQPPQLLVSVASVDEALLAGECGVDIVDVKDPARGSLGMADLAVISGITSALRERFPLVPVSVACGELRQWRDNPEQPMRQPRLFQGSAGWREPFLRDAAYAKLGLSGMRGQPDWSREWQETRRQLAPAANWIAVVYVDDLAAAAPSAEEVVEAAITTGCAGLLLDTWSKTGGGLLDHISLSEILRLREQTRGARLLLALAGSLQSVDWPVLSELSPDVVAVRSAVCRGGDRHAPLDRSRLRDWKNWILSAQSGG